MRRWLGPNIVELVDVEDGVVKVKVIPNPCAAAHPLYHIPEDAVVALIEEQMREDIPEIEKVIAVE